MNENDEIEIDLVEMCKYFLSRWVFIVAAILIGAAVAAGFSKITNKVAYISEAKLYVTIPKTSDKILIRDNANELVQDYIELLKSDLVVERVAEDTKLSKSEVKDSISASQVEGKRFIVIYTQNPDKSKTKAIAKTVLKTMNETITKVLKKEKPIVVGENIKPVKTSSTNLIKNTVFGAGVGFVLIFSFLFVSFIVYSKRKKVKIKRL